MLDRTVHTARRRRALLLRVLRALERGDLDLQARALLAAAIRDEVRE